MIFPLILLALSAVSHFAFFGWPQAVVFDEVYFATFVGDYAKGSYYFDIHPPLAKLMAKFFGDFVGASYDFDFSSIGNTLPWGVVLLRLLPLIAGIFLPIVIYFICRYLNFSKFISFAAGLLILLENSLLVQSRFLLFDSIMLLFGFGAILLYLIYVRNESKKSLLFCSAILAAGALSIKWTGLAYPLIILVAELVRTRRIFKVAAIYACVGICIYLSSFAVHFALLPGPGPGDAFMRPDFREKGFFSKTIDLNLHMYDANKTLTATHSYSSPWFSWPIMLRPVFYWQDTHDDTGNSYIYLLGNPFIYWLGTFSILLLLKKVIFEKNREKIVLFILTGFLVNFIPFIFIGRVMFLYHYEAALVFSIIALAYLLQQRPRLTYTLLVLCFLSFLFFAPLSYGLHLSDAALHARMWIPSWR